MSQAWTPLLVSLIAGLVALWGYLSAQKKATRERKRTQFAQAMRDLVKYSLLNSEGIDRAYAQNPNATLIHERLDVETLLAYHLAFIEIDSPTVFKNYQGLVGVVKGASQEPITGRPSNNDWSENWRACMASMSQDVRKGRVRKLVEDWKRTQGEHAS